MVYTFVDGPYDGKTFKAPAGLAGMSFPTREPGSDGKFGQVEYVCDEADPEVMRLKRGET